MKPMISAIDLQVMSVAQLGALVRDARRAWKRKQKRDPIGKVRERLAAAAKAEGYTLSELFGASWNGRYSRSLQRCRTCGCTQVSACAGGCHWVEPDLCSACVRTPAPIAAAAPASVEPTLEQRFGVHLAGIPAAELTS